MADETNLYGDGLPLGLIGPLTRMGEHIARIDGRTSAEIAALKRDTESIRANQHEANNQLTAFMGLHHASVVEMAKTTKQLDMHMAQCDIRGARLERLAWAALTVMIAVLGYLMSPHFMAIH